MTSTPSTVRALMMLATVAAPAYGEPGSAVQSRAASFVEQHCYDCHQGSEAEAGLDLALLQADLADGRATERWVRVFDRVRAGEMPPQDHEAPTPQAREAFLNTTGEWLRSQQLAQHKEFGRVRARRLTRQQVERSLHRLLGIDIPLADQLPEESRTNGFTTVANGQAMSHFQLQRHLAVVDLALDEAFRRALSGEDEYVRDFDARGVARRNPRRRCREPEMLHGQAVVWNGGVIFYGRLPATSAPESGWYRFTVKVSALNRPAVGGVWTTVRTGLCVSSAPLLTHVTSFEATEKPRTIEFEAWLPRRHMLEIRPGDATLKKARFSGGQIGAGEGGPQNVPGIAIDRVTMTRIHHGASDGQVRQLLFGNLKVKAKPRGRFELLSTSPRQDITRLLVAFARRAFRRPVKNEDVSAYIDQALATFDRNADLAAALRLGYRALLCSPRFVYFTELPGKLDGHAIATRLSYLLTGSTPDQQLSKLADNGALLDPMVIRAETDRLLASQGRQFIEDFAAEWLDLDQINFTVPDRKLFPEFDPVVQLSMLDETHTFLATMLRDNQDVSRLVDADYTYLNSRLAQFYAIDGVEGDNLRRVSLRGDSRRGGLLTHGAILKVTANGSNTSPVVRGVWVSERLLGIPIPPPPDNVPAIEPDIRGAKTIRQQLAKHRSDAACAGCHVKIDPPGFALENFDPAGQWRDRYLQVARGRRSRGAAIDASYSLSDGRKFEDVVEFRRLIAAEPRKLAANVAEKLLVFGTGAPISFADRHVVEGIADEVADDNYGFRSIVHAVVTSSVFLKK